MEVNVKIGFCVRLSGVGEDLYILLSGKAGSAGINIFFFLICPILEIEIVYFMVEDNYHHWEVKSNSKLHLGLNCIDILIGARYQLGCSTFYVNK